MRRKRFKHQVHVLCHMFRGWQLYPDYKFLVNRGAGVLSIDVLSGRCACDENVVESLSIAKALLSWLKEDLEQHSIPLHVVDEARLEVRFRVAEKVTSNPMKTVASGFECLGRIRSAEDVYESELVDNQKVYVTNAL